MNASQARKERARLEGEINNAVAAGAQARNDKAAATQKRQQLTHKLEEMRVQAVRSGELPDTTPLEQELYAVPNEMECDATIDRAARGERDARVELEYLLLDELEVFYADATALSEAALSPHKAALAAIEAARRVAQPAQIEWAKLAPALRTKLRERDEAVGTYHPAGVYQRLTAFPRFPIQTGDQEWTARPAGAARLIKPKKANAAA